MAAVITIGYAQERPRHISKRAIAVGAIAGGLIVASGI
jgi:hypothetical protein